MVLADLGTRISSALRNMSNSTKIDDQVITEMLKEICNALVAADVDFKLVLGLRKKLQAKLKVDEMAAGISKRKLVQQTVMDELCELLNGNNDKAYTPQKGKPNVVMFVGLQGAGKTTTVTKLAYHYKRKGFKACMICADTFRAGAFDQLKQNATRAKIPYYGSYTQTDPVKVAQEGVEKFKEEGYELIIVDTSGRHKQEEALFNEMEQIKDAVNPNQIIFVMDGSIGQAAFGQATAFKKAVDVGAVILTKLDSNASGGGALSAVSATEAPIVFVGTGEHLDDFEPFQTRSFVSKLLGYGDMPNLIKKIQAVAPDQEQQEKLIKNIQQGKFTLRDMYEQFQSLLKMGPLNKVMEMLPGMSNFLKQSGAKDVDSNAKIKSFIVMMDSMTDSELDDNKFLLQRKDGRESRIVRIARGSGHSVRDVSGLLDQFKAFEKLMKKWKNLKVGRSGNINPRNLSQMQNMIPPHLMRQLGGMGGLQNMMKNFNMSDLGGMLGGK